MNIQAAVFLIVRKEKKTFPQSPTWSDLSHDIWIDSLKLSKVKLINKKVYISTSLGGKPFCWPIRVCAHSVSEVSIYAQLSKHRKLKKGEEEEECVWEKKAWEKQRGWTSCYFKFNSWLAKVPLSFFSQAKRRRKEEKKAEYTSFQTRISSLHFQATLHMWSRILPECLFAKRVHE